ncbi:MAG: succinate dehydrogenase, cytochrome b556 subunit [Alphaproteobacteria bacterium]|nr:succinate dehydrogenase, cytochrome b556 subunit [Alphaproteobacteria bacterium]
MSQRPLSPHLTIYRPQISSVLSILHRMTGVALFFGVLLLVVWLSIAAFYPALYSGFYEAMNSRFGRIVLLGFTQAFFYHLCNGVRHLFWDMGKGFELKTMARSGWAVVIVSLSLTLASWCPVLWGVK